MADFEAQILESQKQVAEAQSDERQYRRADHGP
jgi:hypothetical protein